MVKSPIGNLLVATSPSKAERENIADYLLVSAVQIAH